MRALGIWLVVASCLRFEGVVGIPQECHTTSPSTHICANISDEECDIRGNFLNAYGALDTPSSTDLFENCIPVNTPDREIGVRSCLAPQASSNLNFVSANTNSWPIKAEDGVAVYLRTTFNFVRAGASDNVRIKWSQGDSLWQSDVVWTKNIIAVTTCEGVDMVAGSFDLFIPVTNGKDVWTRVTVGFNDLADTTWAGWFNVNWSSLKAQPATTEITTAAGRMNEGVPPQFINLLKPISNESTDSAFSARAITLEPTTTAEAVVTKTPTLKPTRNPTRKPTRKPTKKPTKAPTTKKPTKAPTKKPTKKPTKSPTAAPSKKPTHSPTSTPSKTPSRTPSESPSLQPTSAPTLLPSTAPSPLPSSTPTVIAAQAKPDNSAGQSDPTSNAMIATLSVGFVGALSVSAVVYKRRSQSENRGTSLDLFASQRQIPVEQYDETNDYNHYSPTTQKLRIDGRQEPQQQQPQQQQHHQQQQQQQQQFAMAAAASVRAKPAGIPLARAVSHRTRTNNTRAGTSSIGRNGRSGFGGQRPNGAMPIARSAFNGRKPMNGRPGTNGSSARSNEGIPKAEVVTNRRTTNGSPGTGSSGLGPRSRPNTGMPMARENNRSTMNGGAGTTSNARRGGPGAVTRAQYVPKIRTTQNLSSTSSPNSRGSAPFSASSSPSSRAPPSFSQKSRATPRSSAASPQLGSLSPKPRAPHRFAQRVASSNGMKPQSRGKSTFRSTVGGPIKSLSASHKSTAIMSISQRAELTEFLKLKDTKLVGQKELYAKVNKLAKYPRKELISALTIWYGDVPASLQDHRLSLSKI